MKSVIINVIAAAFSRNPELTVHDIVSTTHYQYNSIDPVVRKLTKAGVLEVIRREPGVKFKYRNVYRIAHGRALFVECDRCHKMRHALFFVNGTCRRCKQWETRSSQCVSVIYAAFAKHSELTVRDITNTTHHAYKTIHSAVRALVIAGELEAVGKQNCRVIYRQTNKGVKSCQ
ncbi:hypothetical protein ACRTC3_16405 [Photobacterium damselae]|uniref:hypothetical protein n=1 Tax=Photobacterium damselae TaxID=38293 RepID=UPI003D7CBD0B